jgi:SNF2 family DNA or RNA helicase
MIRCMDGAIVLDTPAGLIWPTADEIFSVVHEAAAFIRGHPVKASDFTRTGIVFSGFAAEALIELSPSADQHHPGVRVDVKARERDNTVPVPVICGGFADYGCDGKIWLPLSPGSKEAIEVTLGPLSRSGTITFRQYLDSTGRRDSAVTIIDRVPAILSGGGTYPRPDLPLPKAFSGTLYPYQASGFRWLAFMAAQGVPGCLLADEMGLGKTVQVICTFLSCIEAELGTPALIVAPATLLENWRREFAKFAPSIRPVIHRGAGRAGAAVHLQKHEVVITSYETLLSDISLFSRIEWSLVVLDEAQAIKNPNARRTRAVKALPRKVAFAVTGTPVENRLTDLWSIADFLLPDRLGTLSEFQRDFPETHNGAAALEPRITPFILRRRVAEVATDLPPRIDIPQIVDLDALSAAAYERIRQGADPNTPSSALAVLQRLRIFCAHPWLSDELRDITEPEGCSNKLLRVNQILEELFEWTEKVLIFTSFHEMSDILTRSIERRFSVPVWQIDGRTPVSDRQPTVDKFSEIDGSAAMLLNPRAAGTGLNITAANHVIHYNLEWNPAVEDQASARAFRRGQTRPVTVHRLIYSGTVEEFINLRSTEKRDLARHSVIGSDGGGLDPSEILRALKISPSEKI